MENLAWQINVANARKLLQQGRNIDFLRATGFSSAVIAEAQRQIADADKSSQQKRRGSRICQCYVCKASADPLTFSPRHCSQTIAVDHLEAQIRKQKLACNQRLYEKRKRQAE